MGFGRKIENHAAVALLMMYYNFARVHQTVRLSPATAAGVSAKLGNIGDIMASWSA